MNDSPNNDVSDEMLMARADGELDGEDAKIIDARIARDPILRARYALFTDTAEALRAALVSGPIPIRLAHAVQTAPTERRTALPLPTRTIAWPLSLAAALTLAIGLFWALTGGRNEPGALALPDVAQAMTTTLTGQSTNLTDGSRSRVLGTFETTQGLCRLVALDAEEQPKTRFVACHVAGEWQVVLSVASGSGNGFAPASDEATDMIDRFLDSISSGPALSLGQERLELSKLQTN